MDKDRKSGGTVDDYTFSFAAMDLGEQGNTSYLFGASNSSSPQQEVSPADTLFSNGQLVPHTFPAHFINSPRSKSDISRSVSWTTASSKESITSSLRNSSNSSYSRSSSSSNSSSRNSRQNSSTRQGSGSEKANALRKQVRFAPGSQKLAPPSAITSFGVSGRIRRGGTWPQGVKKNEEKKKQEAETRSWVGRTFFRALVSACKGCHALEPSNQPVHPRLK